MDMSEIYLTDLHRYTTPYTEKLCKQKKKILI